MRTTPDATPHTTPHSRDDRSSTTTRRNTAVPRPRRTRWQRFRIAWATTGVLLTIIFVGWSLVAYRANAEARRAIESDASVLITHDDGVWRFTPATGTEDARASLLFFPGALVSPVAYAPLARAVAAAGFPTVLIELPKRGAFGGADDPAVAARALAEIRAAPASRQWIVAGHSRGAVVASSFAARYTDRVAGLVLLGTTHPRDVDLSALAVPVTKIIGSKDGIAPEARSEANRALLPPTVRWIRIVGGNHSQFGWYGFQPGDHFAEISAQEQHERVRSALLEMMQGAAATPAAP